VGVQVVRWGRGSTEPAGHCTFYYGKGKQIHELGNRFFLCIKESSAVKKVEFVSDRMSYIRGHGCDTIVPNVHIPTQDQSDDVKDRVYGELEQVFDKFPKYHMNILLGDFNAKVGREDIFKPTNGNESLHEISNDDVTSKNLIVKSTIFPRCNIHEFIGRLLMERKHNRIHHVLTEDCIQVYMMSYPSGQQIVIPLSGGGKS
jgi:hypothetical protein